MGPSAAASATGEGAAALPLAEVAPATATVVRTRRRRRRAIVIGAPVAYLVALATVMVSWGLPVARDQLFFWLLLGLAAFSVGAWRTWGTMLLAWLPWLGLLVVYDYLRGAVSVDPGRAHVAPQIAVDRALAAGDVPTHWLQRHLWTPGHLHWYDYAVWAVYMTHFFAVWLIAAALWRGSRRRFGQYAVLVAVLTLAAFLVYWRYPAQPPWMAADGIGPVDRIVPMVWDRLGMSAIKSVYENGDLVNTVAAMPSLHAAYPFMLLLFFRDARRPVRAGLAVYTLAMAYALVYAGEHFVSDILAGWAMAGAAYALVAVALPKATAAGRRIRGRRAPPSAAGVSCESPK